MFFAFRNYFFANGHFEFILGKKYVLKRALVNIFLFLRKNLEKGETKNRENEERRGEMSKGKKAKQKVTKDEKI